MSTYLEQLSQEVMSDVEVVGIIESWQCIQRLK
jgi:hypothetical protein